MKSGFGFSAVFSLVVFSFGLVATDVAVSQVSVPAAVPTTDAPPADVADANYFKTYVNRENCSKDQRHYLACISALQVLTGSLDSEMSLKTQTTGIDFLDQKKTKLALNANNLKLITQAREAADANIDLNVSILKQVFERNQKTKDAFRRDFEPAYYHFKVASNDVISDVLNYLEKTYPSKLKEETWMGAVNEYLHISLDPHSDWRLMEETRKSINSKEEEFIGLGIRYVVSPMGATIESVVKGSGADAAGLLPDDTILSINGQQMKGVNRDLVSAAARGEEGGTLDLQVLRKGKTFALRAIRKKVLTPVVSKSTLRTGAETVGMVRLENFTYADACADVSAVLKEFNAAKVDQVILDLRGNGGGAVTIAECLAGLFIGSGTTIAYSEGRGNLMLPPASMGSALERAKMMLKAEVDQLIIDAGEQIDDEIYQNYLAMLRAPETLDHVVRSIELNDQGLDRMVSSGDQVYDGKLAVLVDGSSASASELIAGAFRDLNRALIVGQTTFGKGSYQTNGSIQGRFQRWQTGGLFFQPSGSTNQTVGVKPHIEAFRELEPSIVETFQMRERDMFLYPLEPRSVRNVVPDADQMNKLEAPTECLKTKNVKAAYEAETDPLWKDMQALSAAAALSCMN